MSNAALSVLRTRLRAILNESTAGFWSDANLNIYIAMAVAKYHDWWTRHNPHWGKSTIDVTYTASAESVTITVSTGNEIMLVDYIEDRTNAQPGPHIDLVNTKEELADHYGVYNDTSWDGIPLVAYIEVVEAEAVAGVKTHTYTIFLAPKPGSAHSLRLHTRRRPPALTSDTHTSGLPDIVEECVVLHAAMLARSQEESPPGGLVQLLEMAERGAISSAKPLRSGPDSMVYYGQ